MFPHGAATYIDDIGKLIPLHDGSIHTALHTGCGVRLFDRNRTQKNSFKVKRRPVEFWGQFQNSKWRSREWRLLPLWVSELSNLRPEGERE
jgi:hypothetical protein